MNVFQILGICGMISPIVYTAMWILVGSLQADYSHIRNDISSLFAVGAPNKRRRVIINSLITGEHRIHTNAKVFIGDTNYMIFTSGAYKEEVQQHLWSRPYSWSALLDEEVEVEFKKFGWYDKNGEVFGDGIPVYWTVFYHIYEPYSLAEGEHRMDHEISFYQGTINREQIFITWTSYFEVLPSEV